MPNLENDLADLHNHSVNNSGGPRAGLKNKSGFPEALMIIILVNLSKETRFGSNFEEILETSKSKSRFLEALIVNRLVNFRKKTLF